MGNGSWIESQLYILKRKDIVDGGRHLVYRLYCGCILAPSEGPAKCVPTFFTGFERKKFEA
jgi:hypothetical protein